MLENAFPQQKFVSVPEMLGNPELVNQASIWQSHQVSFGYQILQHIVDGVKENPGLFVQGLLCPNPVTISELVSEQIQLQIGQFVTSDDFPEILSQAGEKIKKFLGFFRSTK